MVFLEKPTRTLNNPSFLIFSNMIFAMTIIGKVLFSQTQYLDPKSNEKRAIHNLTHTL